MPSDSRRLKDNGSAGSFTFWIKEMKMKILMKNIPCQDSAELDGF
jgi:hypothetical protein